VIQLIQGHFVDEYDPTIEDSYRKQVAIDSCKMMMLDVLDTAAVEEYSAMRDQWLRNGEAFIIIYDITSRASFDAVAPQIEKIRNIKETERVAIGTTPNDCEMRFRFCCNLFLFIQKIIIVFPHSIVIAGNKKDLAMNRKVSIAEGVALARDFDAVWAFVCLFWIGIWN
jgi:GTPase SAR1 family protein